MWIAGEMGKLECVWEFFSAREKCVHKNVIFFSVRVNWMDQFTGNRLHTTHMSLYFQYLVDLYVLDFLLTYFFNNGQGQLLASSFSSSYSLRGHYTTYLSVRVFWSFYGPNIETRAQLVGLPETVVNTKEYHVFAPMGKKKINLKNKFTAKNSLELANKLKGIKITDETKMASFVIKNL